MMFLAPLLTVFMVAPLFTVKQTVPLRSPPFGHHWVDARHAVVEIHPPVGDIAGDGLSETLAWTLLDAETGQLTMLRLEFADWARAHTALLLPPRDQQHFVPVELLDVDVARNRAWLRIQSSGADRERTLLALWDLDQRTITWTIPFGDDVESLGPGVTPTDETEVLGIDAQKRRVLLARHWRSTPAGPACRDPMVWTKQRFSPKLAVRCGVDRLTFLEIDLEQKQRRELYTLPLPLTVGGPTLFADPDATRVFMVEWTHGQEPGFGTVIDLARKTMPVRHARLSGSTSGIVWTRDALFFGVSQMKSIARVDLRTGAVARFAGWPRLNFGITAGPDGHSILALSDGYRVGVFDVNAKPPASAHERPGLDDVRFFDGARFSPDGRHALAPTEAAEGKESELLLLEVAP